MVKRLSWSRIRGKTSTPIAYHKMFTKVKRAWKWAACNCVESWQKCSAGIRAVPIAFQAWPFPSRNYAYTILIRRNELDLCEYRKSNYLEDATGCRVMRYPFAFQFARHLACIRRYIPPNYNVIMSRNQEVLPNKKAGIVLIPALVESNWFWKGESHEHSEKYRLLRDVCL